MFRSVKFMYKKPLYLCLLSFLVVIICTPLQANEHAVGDITIHYNAINTAVLTPEVATQYGITRSASSGLINISVHKDQSAVIANIFGHAQNLAGQLKKLGFKEVREDDAIYYLATFQFSDGEDLIFDLQVQPEKNGILIPLKFKQQLFVK